MKEETRNKIKEIEKIISDESLTTRQKAVILSSLFEKRVTHLYTYKNFHLESELKLLDDNDGNDVYTAVINDILIKIFDNLEYKRPQKRSHFDYLKMLIKKSMEMPKQYHVSIGNAEIIGISGIDPTVIYKIEPNIVEGSSIYPRSASSEVNYILDILKEFGY